MRLANSRKVAFVVLPTVVVPVVVARDIRNASEAV
jgi:hypothetical protein